METKSEADVQTNEKHERPQVNTSIYTIPRGLMWLLKPRRRYNSSKKIEWIVEWLIKGFLVFWAYTFVRAIIILILGTMRHYGVIE